MKLLNVTAVDAASNSLLGKKQGCLLKLFLCGELVRTKLNIEQLPWDIENEIITIFCYACFSKILMSVLKTVTDVQKLQTVLTQKGITVATARRASVVMVTRVLVSGFSCSNYCFSYGGASLGAKRPATVKHHGYIGVGKSRRGCTQLCQ